jgi:nucleotide-binding universal stress UspA family protein
MLPIRTIIHATDFSDSSAAAFGVACALARDYGARLLVLHVLPEPMGLYIGEGVFVPPENEREEALKALRNLRAADASVRVEHRLVEGNPVDEILRLAKNTDCDVLVLGTHGRKGLGRLLMGSVAEHVMRRATCPVVTVKTPVSTEVTVNGPDREAASEKFQGTHS